MMTSTDKKIEFPQGFSQPGMYEERSDIEKAEEAGKKALYEIFFKQINSRKDVLNFEKWLSDLPSYCEGNPYPLFHKFANGMYSREIHFKKNDIINGAIHPNEYFVNVLKGRIWVVSEFGAKEIAAPAHFVAKAGVKHIGYTLEDTVWVDIHNVKSTTIEEAENEILVSSYDELDEYNGVIKTEFAKMCDDLGYTEEEVRRLSEVDIDILKQPETDPVEIKESSIEGMGVFATEDIKQDQPVAMARLDQFRTHAGRYTNHSDNPNSKPYITRTVMFFAAIEDIKKGDEITVDYRDVREKALILDGGM